MALFWMFCGGMALVTLTPRWVVQALADLLQGCGWDGEGNPFFAPGTVNLVPFRTLGDGYILAGNLIMFLPFGFFPALLWRGCTWKRALAAGLCVTGFIECWQLLVGRREVLSAVHRLNREKGITVVLITHHMNEAEDADRVVVMDDGKVIMDGAPRQVFTQVERLRSMGLTVPDTVDLLDRLRKDGLDVPLTALTVEECADAILAAVSK